MCLLCTLTVPWANTASDTLVDTRVKPLEYFIDLFHRDIDIWQVGTAHHTSHCQVINAVLTVFTAILKRVHVSLCVMCVTVVADDAAPLSSPCGLSESQPLEDENMEWPESHTGFLKSSLGAASAPDGDLDLGGDLVLGVVFNGLEDLSFVFLCCGLFLDLDFGLFFVCTQCTRERTVKRSTRFRSRPIQFTSKGTTGQSSTAQMSLPRTASPVPSRHILFP